MQQIVDIALKALSPGINDPSTVITCIDQLGDLMVSLAMREKPGPYRSNKDVLRVIAQGPDFASMLALSFDAITDYAANAVEVYASLLATLGGIADATTSPSRRRCVAAQLDLVMQSAIRASLPLRRQAALEQQRAAVQSRIQARIH